VCQKMVPVNQQEIFEAVQVYPDSMPPVGGTSSGRTMPADIFGVQETERVQWEVEETAIDPRCRGQEPGLGEEPASVAALKRTSFKQFGGLLDVEPAQQIGYDAEQMRVAHPATNGTTVVQVLHANSEPSAGSRVKRASFREAAPLDPEDLLLSRSENGHLQVSTASSTLSNPLNGPLTGVSQASSSKPSALKRSSTEGNFNSHRSKTPTSEGRGSLRDLSSTPTAVDGPLEGLRSQELPTGSQNLSRRGVALEQLLIQSGVSNSAGLGAQAAGGLQAEPERQLHPFLQRNKFKSENSEFTDFASQGEVSDDFDIYEYTQPEFQVELMEEHGPMGIRVIAFRTHMLMVAEVADEGAIPRWNAAHPDACVRVGDALLDIEGIGRAGVRTLERFFTDSAPEEADHFSMKMVFRHDAFELFLGTHLSHYPRKLGINVESIDDGRLLRVTEVDDGLIYDWNVEAIPYHLSVGLGDVIIEVDGKRGTAEEMRAALQGAKDTWHMKVVHVNKAGTRILTHVESGKSDGSSRGRSSVRSVQTR